MPPEVKSAPANACRFRASELKFADAGPAVDGRPAPVAVSILARSAEPVNHYWWGKVYHDMAGFAAHKDTVVLDYCHDDDDIVGHADKFDPSAAGLQVQGLLIPFAADDTAAEIIYRRSQGTPYEASIYFEPHIVEQVLDGATADVNGQTVTGPACIIREWSLLSVAICPHGYDSATQVADEGESELAHPSARARQFSFTQKGTPMPTADATVPETKPAELAAPAAPPVNQFAAAQAELAKFVTRFGAEAGAKHFAAGTAYAAAMETEFDALKASHATQFAALNAEVAALKTKLGLVDRGEEKPAKFQDAGAPDAPVKHQFNGLSENLQRFAAGIELPGKNK